MRICNEAQILILFKKGDEKYKEMSFVLGKIMLEKNQGNYIQDQSIIS